jgi:hypothetical protein
LLGLVGTRLVTRPLLRPRLYVYVRATHVYTPGVAAAMKDLAHLFCRLDFRPPTADNCAMPRSPIRRLHPPRLLVRLPLSAGFLLARPVLPLPLHSRPL